MNRRFASTFLIALIMLFGCSATAFSQAKSKKVRELEKQRKAALEQVEKTEREIQAVKKDRSKKQKEEKLLKQQVKQREKALSILDAEIKALNQDIDSLAKVEKQLKTQEETHKEAYARSLQQLQLKKNSSNDLAFILSAESFDQGIRRARFVAEYADAHEKAANDLRKTREELAITQSNIASNKQSKSHLVVVRTKEKAKLEKRRVKADKEIASLKGKEQDLKKQKEKYQRRANALNKQIEKQIAYEIAEAERKAREAANKKGSKEKRVAANKGGYAMTAEERKLSGSFASNKGNLLVPVSGRYTIVSHFGVQQHKEASKVQTNNAGIDISVPQGTTARAVFTGVVSKIFVVPGYHNSIIIRHGNYLTVYANLSNVYVKAGQKVTTGQKLGTIATDEGKTILHFQVWYERNKQNPELWIR